MEVDRYEMEEQAIGEIAFTAPADHRLHYRIRDNFPEANVNNFRPPIKLDDE
jgi:hypothetical protein